MRITPITEVGYTITLTRAEAALLSAACGRTSTVVALKYALETKRLTKSEIVAHASLSDLLDDIAQIVPFAHI